MGTLTISMNEEDEKLLREFSIKKYGNKKGALSKTIKEAVMHLATKHKDEKYLKLAREGISLGKIDMKKLREEMYGRNNRI